MTLPTSHPSGGINPNLRPLQINPVATAPAINALFEAYKNGLIQADDIQDRLLKKPTRDQAEIAANKDAIEQARTAPVRRAQEMDAATQQSKLRDLQIKASTQELADAPGRRELDRKAKELEVGAKKLELDDYPERRDSARKVEKLSIEKAELDLANAKDPAGGVQKKADGEVIAKFIKANPGVPLPRTPDGRADMSAIGKVLEAQPDLRPVLGPDGKPVSGVGKDSEDRIHSIPRSAAPTEAQAHAQLFGDRMEFQRQLLEKYETGENKAKYDPTTTRQMPEVGPGNLLSTPIRMLTSSDHNSYIDAKENWITALNRYESGASIAKTEKSDAERQYFPQPGDSAEQVKSKQLLRRGIEEKMKQIGEVPGVSSLTPDSSKTPESRGAKAPTDITKVYETIKPGEQYVDPQGNIRVKQGTAPASAAPAPALPTSPKVQPAKPKVNWGALGSVVKSAAPLMIPRPLGQ